LQGVAALSAILLAYMLKKANQRLDRMAGEDAELTEQDLAVLKRTAEAEGIDIASARRMQKGYRYTI